MLTYEGSLATRASVTHFSPTFSCYFFSLNIGTLSGSAYLGGLTSGPRAKALGRCCPVCNRPLSLWAVFVFRFTDGGDRQAGSQGPPAMQSGCE